MNLWASTSMPNQRINGTEPLMPPLSEKAEVIRCRRFESIVNERYDFFDKSKMKGDFLAYYKDTSRKHDQKWSSYICIFFNFVGGKCSFEEIDVDFYATSSESICLMRNSLNVPSVPYHAIRSGLLVHIQRISKYSLSQQLTPLQCK